MTGEGGLVSLRESEVLYLAWYGGYNEDHLGVLLAMVRSSSGRSGAGCRVLGCGLGGLTGR